jgi:Xaa-Pro aminopeptidase
VRRPILLAALLASLAPTAAWAQIPAAEYAARREALGAKLQDGAAVVAFGAEEPRQDYLSFYQGSRFRWLTGLVEPGAALVLARSGGKTAATLFVERRDPAREAWSGARLGVEGAARLTGMPARPADSLAFVLDSLAKAGATLHLVSDAGAEGADAAAANPDVHRLAAVLGAPASAADVARRSANGMVDQLRGTKSAAEMDLIRRSVDITVRAQREAMRAIEPGMNEFEVQALIEYTFRRNGADRTSFATIVGSGPNSTTLHYNADDRFMQAGEVVVMDIGASYRGYAADVTRTVPVSGTFTPEQRAIYQTVRDAQAAAEKAAKPGTPWMEVERAAARVLAQGLARAGLIESPEATYDCGAGDQPTQCPQLRLFYFHGLGHGIGLDVHDPEQFYYSGIIQAGSAFTIEPGLYVRADVLEHLRDTPRNRAMVAKLRPAVQRHANIGVRIEDDYLCAESGCEWISRAPREAAEVEALMKERWAGPAARDTTVVEWYRKTGGR